MSDVVARNTGVPHVSPFLLTQIFGITLFYRLEYYRDSYNLFEVCKYLYSNNCTFQEINSLFTP